MIRLYLADKTQMTEPLEELFKDVAKDKGEYIDITVLRDRIIKKIPRGFDTYFLHLSYIDKEDLIELRKEQPWSWIYRRTGAGISEIDSEVRVCLDRLNGIDDLVDIENMISEMTTHRKSEEI